MNNSEIRSVTFEQGVEIFPPGLIDSPTGKLTLINGAVNDLDFSEMDASETVCQVVEYYIYRRTSAGYRGMTGKVILFYMPDGVDASNKFGIDEANRSEYVAESGITFGRTSTLTTSKLTATLDSMAGTGHDCAMYYKITSFLV